MENLDKASDSDLLNEISNRFMQKESTLVEMQEMTQRQLKLNKRLRNAESMKEKFISLIKNEFNNPMMTLLNLSTRVTSTTKPERLPQIGKMMRLELLRMNFQLKNIFAMTELEAGQMQTSYSKIDMSELLEDIKEALDYVIDDKKSIINLDVLGIELVSDVQKIFLMLVNLISNAIEFAPENSSVNIKLYEENKKIIISVEDFGEGVGSTDHSIFDSFSTYNSGKFRNITGLGIGLAVARSIATTLDGLIEFESKEGHTIFKIILPIVSSEAMDSSIGSNEFMFDDFDDEMEEF